ncbi:hypothetical protein GCM10023116_46420 [Kistimonas scapharcae]|uniref:CdiI immunity protein domain-containing protein n=1 Tax=Kistimonas scapharcae TaxID=1036133 RepID=A0ABP8V9Z0_9GAMM
MSIQNAKPIDDLELYELIVAAYPEKFDANSEDDIWDEVLEWAEEEFCDIDALSRLLGRLLYLTSPMQSAISGEYVHCLGKVDIKDGQANMVAAVSRRIAG